MKNNISVNEVNIKENDNTVNKNDFVEDSSDESLYNINNIEINR